MRREHALLLALVGCAAGVFPTAAHAFCRTTTVAAPPDFSPTNDGCWTQGVPLYWANSCVGYSLQRDASRALALATASPLVDRAFAVWNAAACNVGAFPVDGGAPVAVQNPSIHAAQLANVTCGVVGYSQTGSNQNTIVFRDDAWPHKDSLNLMSLTTLTFNPDTGEIYDADMEINTSLGNLSAGDPLPKDSYDLLSVLTHEAGHFLGLAHSASVDATMFPSFGVGETSVRSLAADDVAAICDVYRPTGERATAAGLVPALACDPTPRHGFSVACAPEPSPTNGWSCAAAFGSGKTSSGALAAGAVAMTACALMRRRRRSPRKSASVIFDHAHSI